MHATLGTQICDHHYEHTHIVDYIYTVTFEFKEWIKLKNNKKHNAWLEAGGRVTESCTFSMYKIINLFTNTVTTN
jgi:hypothetical protein